jgi:hypothetical protein
MVARLSGAARAALRLLAVVAPANAHRARPHLADDVGTAK